MAYLIGGLIGAGLVLGFLVWMAYGIFREYDPKKRTWEDD